MRIRSAFIGIAGLLLAALGALYTSHAGAAEYNRRLVLIRAHYLCDWAPTHLDIRENPMTFCKSLTTWALEGYGYEKIETEVMLWWAFWIRKDPALGAAYLGKFEDAFAAEEREMQLAAEGRSPRMKARARQGEVVARNASMMSPADLCFALNFYRLRAFRQELERRHVLSEEEWHLIDEERLKIGMSELAMVCSWGKPKRVDRVIDAAPEHKMHVYAEDRIVHTENGHVTAVQDADGRTRPYT